MPKTQKACLEAGLKAMGFKLDTTARTSKYSVYVRDDVEYKYLVGRSGALRRTRGRISQSISLTGGRIAKAYIKLGESEWKSYEEAEKAFRTFLEPAKKLHKIEHVPPIEARSEDQT